MANAAISAEERKEEAKRKLGWGVSYVNETFRPKVTAYDGLAFYVEFWEKTDLLLAVKIPQEKIDDCNPKEKILPGYLRGVFRSVKMAKSKKERR